MAGVAADLLSGGKRRRRMRTGLGATRVRKCGSHADVIGVKGPQRADDLGEARAGGK